MQRPKKLAHEQRAKLRSIQIEDLKTDEQKILLLLKYGILAPSTHNTQPWKLKIIGQTVEVYADFAKRLSQADPKGRDLYMSLGALIKNTELAAREFGIEATTQRFASTNQDHVATILLHKLNAAHRPVRSEVLDAITERQNYRGFFLSEHDGDEIHQIVKSAQTSATKVDLIVDKTIIQKLASLTARGLRMAYATPAFRQEISSYLNHNLSSKRYGLHGYSLRLNLPRSLAIPKIMKRKDLGAKLSQLNYDSFVTAPGVIVLSSKDNEAGWLEAGLVLEDIMVKLTSVGLSCSIYAAAIEMGDLRKQVKQLLPANKTGVVPQLLFCVGRPSAPLDKSVRKDLSEVLIQ